MAIGDMATNISVAGTVQATITLTCPNCGTVNTPQVSKPFTQAVTVYGSIQCSNCAKRLFITLVIDGASAQAQQVQP